MLEAFKLWAPRPSVSPLEWVPEHVSMPEGEPWSVAAYPHLSAPGGPFDAFMDPSIRNIWLQFATRLGKTAMGLSAIMHRAANDPCPMLFATATESLVHRIIRDKLEKMIERCQPIKNQLRPPHRRRADRIDLAYCRIYAAWSGSSGQLADLSAKVMHGNEIDKWDSSTSTEGDPLKLFLERAKDIPTRKVILESTPSVRGFSRVETGRLSSDNRQYWVPCPHCGEYQTLRMGDGSESGGIQWDKSDDGHSDPDTAHRTARYVCRACERPIYDHHRAPMMRAGVWAPAGCKVVAGAVVGEPLRRGPDAGFQLSSLYALTLSWGDIAREFIVSKKRPKDLQNFVNSWLAETWEPRRSRSEPEQLAERLGTERPRRIVPADCLLITAGIDKQGESGDYFPFAIWGWGEGETGWLIDWGEAFTTTEIEELLATNYQREGGGPALRIALALMDSGYRTKEVYEFCNRHGRLVIPCKGSNTFMLDPYKFATLDGGEITRQRRQMTANGQLLCHVNTDFWEGDLQNRFDERKAGEVGSLSLPREAVRDLDLLQQLCNAALTDSKDTRGNAKLTWVKRQPSEPNDFRDATRYAMCAMKAWLDDKQGRWPVKPNTQPQPQRQPQQPSGYTRPDGRRWV